MGEVGKGDDADAPHARGFAQHDLGIAQVLQGVDLQHDVEALVLERGQALVQVELQHVDAALHAGQHVVVVDLDTVAGAAALARQVRQQRAVAAAQVEHVRALRHQAGDDAADGFVAHACNSCAMRSK